MLSICARATFRSRTAGYLAKSYLRAYSCTTLKSPYGEIRVPDETVTDFLLSRSDDWSDFSALRHAHSAILSLPAIGSSDNVCDCIFHATRKTCGVSGRSYTYAVMKMLCVNVAKAFLTKVGLRPGDTVGLLLPNLPEYAIAVHASLSAGLTVTFANPLFTTDETARQFHNAEVKCIVTVSQLLQTALEVSKVLPGYANTVNVTGKTEPEKNILGLETLLTEEHNVELPRVKSTDVAVLPYSSGTTGMPKGVMLTHQNLMANLLQITHPNVLGASLPTGDFQETVLSVLPLYHIFGFNGILNATLYNGAHLITIPRFSIQDYLNCLVRYKPSVLFVVPSLMSFLALHPEVDERHLSSVKKVICGAAPASKTLFEAFVKKVSREDCAIHQGYGMTETSPVTLFSPRAMPKSKLGSCGHLLPSTEGRLIDLTSGKDITIPGESGELLVKGPQLMKGYLKNAMATSEVIDADGWLHTGDVAYFDEDGYFFIIDRTKELIKVKGNQVSPSELESIIMELPGLADAAVIGVPDAIAGEVPKAFVVKKPGSNITAETILDYVTPKMAPYKKLVGGVIFIESIPRNSSGKIMRNELKN